MVCLARILVCVCVLVFEAHTTHPEHKHKKVKELAKAYEENEELMEDWEAAVMALREGLLESGG